jgi:hypothetical protein
VPAPSTSWRLLATSERQKFRREAPATINQGKIAVTSKEELSAADNLFVIKSE